MSYASAHGTQAVPVQSAAPPQNPTAKYRATDWPDYDAALVRRGALTVWFTEKVIAAWRAPATGGRGGQPIYSTLVIETALTLRLVFHQPLRQTEGLLRSIVDVLGAHHKTRAKLGVVI